VAPPTVPISNEIIAQILESLKVNNFFDDEDMFISK
jgi:hypothetical protein